MKLLLMNSLIAVVAILPVDAGINPNQTPEEWHAMWQRDFAKAEAGDLNTAWSIVYPALRSLGRFTDESRSEIANDVYSRAQEIIFSKPGYTDWMLSRIRWNQDNVREAEKGGDEYAINKAIFDYVGEREKFFLGLAQLPSHETVEFLGELLEDEETIDVGIRTGFYHADTNATQAAITLKRLEVGPIPGATIFKDQDFASAEEIELFRDWWKEVKAGKRDYVFGWKAWGRNPAGNAIMLPKEQWPPDPFAKKALPEKPLPPAPETEKSNKLPGPALWSALALLAAAGVYWLVRSRKIG